MPGAGWRDVQGSPPGGLRWVKRWVRDVGAHPSFSVEFCKICFHHALCNGEGGLRPLSVLWVIFLLPRWRKKPIKADVSTAHHCLQQKGSLEQQPSSHQAPGLKCQAQGGSGSHNSGEEKVSVAGICCPRKSKYRTYIPVCAWRRWGRKQNSPDSLMSTAPRQWMLRFAN